MQRKDLPPRYYLEHFRDMLGAIQKNHSTFLEPVHSNFLKEFSRLPEEAQCLYVRFVNRKGRYFFRETLRYAEIEDLDGAKKILIQKNFLRLPRHEELLLIFAGLSRDKLLGYCELMGLPVKRSWHKAKLLEIISTADLSRFPLSALGSCVVQERVEELSYLLFLYFGETSENLSLYTLRDLGIWSENKRSMFVPKFQSREEARSRFFFARLSDELDAETYDISLIADWPPALSDECLTLREALLVSLGESLRKRERFPEALEVLSLSTTHPGRERRVRLLHQLGRSEEVLHELQLILDDPDSDEELYFAEDFLERKFHQKRRTALTELLSRAQVLPLDEAWFRRPEEGVRISLELSGGEAYHAENDLWRALFGILFWEEIFESPLNTFHSPFERLPEELGSTKFYDKHYSQIQDKLRLLRSPEAFLKHVTEVQEKTGQDKNGLFSWSTETLRGVFALVQYAPADSVGHVLLHLAQDFHDRMKGFPDLMVVKNGELQFLEVKAPGDSLRGHQLMRMNLLKAAGLHVELLRIEYRVGPGQTYVVVDLETTGGMQPYHRITEIGAVKICDGKVIDTYGTLVNPGRRISAEIQSLTGITNEMVATAPSFSEVAETFLEFSRDAIFVAHNVQFDYGFLQAEYERLEIRFVRPFLCTKVLAKKHFPGLESYGLRNLTNHFGIPLLSHHRALCDAEATARLFLLINEKR